MTATRLLLQSARLALFESEAASGIDVKGWIADQNYFIDTDILKNEFVLRASDPSELQRALANDLNRMAIAAFESAAGVRPDQALPRSIAWGAIRAYYASFFAAHSFLRLFGVSCSQLDQEHVTKIFQSSQVFGKSNGLLSIEAGFYSIDIDPAYSVVTFRKLRDSHKDTWATLLAKIENLESMIPTATAIGQHKIDAAAILSDLKAGISMANNGSGNWLSVMRNSMNYRHTHGVWYPYSAKTARGDLLEAASRNWLNAPSIEGWPKKTSELEIFFNVSVLLVSLVRVLIVVASGLQDNLNPVLKNGCIKLLNELKVAPNGGI